MFSKSFDVPIAFIVFNRPEIAAQTFEQIRHVRPKHLCIISDGPRDHVDGEAERVEQSRAVAESCDWPCEVQRIYSDMNLGCGKRVSSGISEVFRNHEQAIIVEDDCLVEDSFFDYCSTLLNRYASDTRIMAISGDNFHQGKTYGDSSYYFSKYPHCWGWATWRRAWQHYDAALKNWPSYRSSQDLAVWSDSYLELDYWIRNFDAVYEERIDTWDFTWTLACWMQNGLTALPNVNLVSNLGFGPEATHTTGESQWANLPTSSIGKLKHPTDVRRCYVADRSTDLRMFSRNRVRAKHVIRSLKRWSEYRIKAA